MSIILLAPGADLFISGAELLVNPVNCRGVAGGLHKEFAHRFPAQEKAYKRLCRDWLLRPGSFALLRPVVYFATKDDWKKPSSLPWVDSGLKSLSGLCIRQGVQTIAIPALGCGLGGLKWETVLPLIQAAFGGLTYTAAFVYPPHEER